MSLKNLTENAVYYHNGQFPPTKLSYERLLPYLLKATDALSRYDQELKTLHNSELLLAPLRNQEALMSSRMEGTISTMDEIMRYEADAFDDDPSSGVMRTSADVRSETIETVLYQRSLMNAHSAIQDGYPLSESLIKTLHRQLLSFGRGVNKSPGQYKTEQNYLADSIQQRILFVPIAPEHLVSGMQKLFAYINDPSSSHPLLIKTALAHLEYEALHPFKDGNGRIGRMLIPLMLWSGGAISAPHFYISGFMERNKDQYIDRMRAVSEHNAWDDWCVFFLTAIEAQAHENLKITLDIHKLYENMKDKFAHSLSSKWSIGVLDFVFTQPYFRSNRLAQKLGVSSASAMRFIRILHEQGLIQVVEEPAGRKSGLYKFEPLLNLVRT